MEKAARGIHQLKDDKGSGAVEAVDFIGAGAKSKKKPSEKGLEYDKQPLLGREWINQLQILEKLKESPNEMQSPVFLRSRQVPFQIKNKVENELDRMVQAEILNPVKASKWATPIVPVLKRDGSIRICGDFSVTVNPCIVADEHPLPTHEELFAKMAG
ncbi:hypothetical protein RF55_18821, partial [Lasius niger]